MAFGQRCCFVPPMANCQNFKEKLQGGTPHPHWRSRNSLPQSRPLPRPHSTRAAALASAHNETSHAAAEQGTRRYDRPEPTQRPRATAAAPPIQRPQNEHHNLTEKLGENYRLPGETSRINRHQNSLHRTNPFRSKPNEIWVRVVLVL